MESAAVPLGDLMGDEQPQPKAVGLGGYERMEQLIAHRCGRTRTSVAHAD
jgi:hypothetical protein